MSATRLAQYAVAAVRPLVDRDNPWPGLAPYTEESRGFFHGRHEEIEDLTSRVLRQRLTVLFSPSGVGKTSLLGAGLVPRLRDTAMNASGKK